MHLNQYIPNTSKTKCCELVKEIKRYLAIFTIPFFRRTVVRHMLQSNAKLKQLHKTSDKMMVYLTSCHVLLYRTILEIVQSQCSVLFFGQNPISSPSVIETLVIRLQFMPNYKKQDTVWKFTGLSVSICVYINFCMVCTGYKKQIVCRRTNYAPYMFLSMTLPSSAQSICTSS